MKTHTRVISDLIQQYANEGVGAEIGVYQGDTSRHILKTTKTQMLYMVDQYTRNYDTKQWMYTTKHDPKGDPDKDYNAVQTAFISEFPGRHAICRQSSEEASHDLDVELDFIFIDANHQYKPVLMDLTLWVPKIKPGGLIMGHDWRSKFPGVISAVIEYANSTSSFVLPHKPRPLKKIPGVRYKPAPSGSPVVMKSWPSGNVWWALKNG